MNTNTETMSPEAQRIAIATACGKIHSRWHFRRHGHDGTLPVRYYRTQEDAENDWCALAHNGHSWGAVSPLEQEVDFDRIPDYLNDLNAAMELVNHMCRNGQTVRIDNGLDGTWEVTFGIPNGDYTTVYAASESLAATICEAALNSLNLWKP